MKQAVHRTAWRAGIYPLSLAVMLGLGWMDSIWYRGLRGRVPQTALDGAAAAMRKALS